MNCSSLKAVSLALSAVVATSLSSNEILVPEEVALMLKALSVLAEDQNLVPSTHTGQLPTSCEILDPQDLNPSFHFHGHLHTCKHAHTHTI